MRKVNKVPKPWLWVIASFISLFSSFERQSNTERKKERKGREREREYALLLVHFLNAYKILQAQKPETQSGSPTQGQGPGHWSHHLLLLKCVNRKLKVQELDSHHYSSMAYGHPMHSSAHRTTISTYIRMHNPPLQSHIPQRNGWFQGWHDTNREHFVAESSKVPNTLMGTCEKTPSKNSPIGETLECNGKKWHLRDPIPLSRNPGVHKETFTTNEEKKERRGARESSYRASS